MKQSFTLLTGILVVLMLQPALGQQAPMVEQYLLSGKLADGEAALTQHLQANATDDQARFGLGALQVIRAVEHLMQNSYQYGLRVQAAVEFSFFRLPLPDNPNPRPMTYETAGKIMRQWNDELAKAEATLAAVKAADVKLPLKFGLIRLDFDGDGKADEDETLWKVY